MLGASQSGHRSSLRLLRVLDDADVIARARDLAERCVAADPGLADPGLADTVGADGAPGRRGLAGAHVSRIIAGSRGGRRLTTPPGARTRPTTDRVREALFSAVAAWAGTADAPADEALAGLAFADLFAGSGAVGLEAASRGAGPVLLVEADKRTAAVTTRNVRDLGLAALVRTGRVETVVAAPAEQAYDVVFLDPPYELDGAALDRGDDGAGRRRLAGARRACWSSSAAGARRTWSGPRRSSTPGAGATARPCCTTPPAPAPEDGAEDAPGDAGPAASVAP